MQRKYLLRIPCSVAPVSRTCKGFPVSLSMQHAGAASHVTSILWQGLSIAQILSVSINLHWASYRTILQGLRSLEGHLLGWLRSCAMRCVGLSVTTDELMPGVAESALWQQEWSESCGSHKCGAFQYPRTPNCPAESRPATMHDYGTTWLSWHGQRRSERFLTIHFHTSSLLDMWSG